MSTENKSVFKKKRKKKEKCIHQYYIITQRVPNPNKHKPLNIVEIKMIMSACTELLHTSHLLHVIKRL